MAIHWKRLLPLVSLFLMAGCSSVNDIVVGLGTGILDDLMAQTTPFDSLSVNFTAAPEDDSEVNVDALLAQAEALATDGEFAAALVLADEAVALAPANATAHWMRGHFLYRLNDLETALAAYDRAIQAGMDWSRGYLTLSYVYRSAGDAAAEIAALTKAIDFSRAYADESVDLIVAIALLRRSELWTQSGDLAAAIADLEAALSRNPWDYDQYAILRNLRHQLAGRQTVFTEDPALLLAHLDKRLTNDPADAQARLDRGYLILQLAFIDGDTSNLNAAYQDFTLALSIDPALAAAYHGRALATWVAYETFAGIGEMDIEEILALAENVSILNFQAADATVTISGGTVTMTNTRTGAVAVQSVAEWRQALPDLPLLQDATPEAALADLDTALSLAPDLVTARHDRGVMRFTTWFDDAWLSLMFDGPPGTPDENLAAAVSDLEFAVQQLPDWPVARFNRGLARLYQGITLFGVYMANSEDEETGEAIQTALEDAITDASWLIDQDENPGWSHFMRFMAISFLQDLGPNIDPSLNAYAETDARRIFELIPDLNTDDAVLQLADQARLSLQVAPPLLVSAGRLEVSDDDLFYTNTDYGLRMKLPERIFDSAIVALSTDRNLIVHMADSLRRLEVLVILPQMGDRSLDDWLADTLLSATSAGAMAEAAPLQTRYGPARYYQYTGETKGGMAILPIGDYVFSFEYLPGPYEDTSPPSVVLKNLIDGITVDDVVDD